MFSSSSSQALPAFRIIHHVYAIMLLFALTACSTNKSDEPAPADVLYREGQLAMHAGNFLTASTAFDAITNNYPYSKFNSSAILLSGYCKYQRGAYDDAIHKLNDYARSYPASKNIAYALYLKSLSYYERISDIQRDQGNTQNAKDNFHTLINRFPETNYARDAKLKLALINANLAGKSLDIGRHHQKRNLCSAAIARFHDVINNYPTTAHTPEALHRLVECYISLDIIEEAKKSAAILGHNYPNSYWYQNSWLLINKNQEK